MKVLLKDPCVLGVQERLAVCGSHTTNSDCLVSLSSCIRVHVYECVYVYVYENVYVYMYM